MKLLTRLGLTLTVIWVSVIGTIVYLKWDLAVSIELNSWGDFLAGLSAPIALLWLVIGYFQQGEELRLNTKALEAQQEELKRQVAETAQLAQKSERQAAASEMLAMLTKDEMERKELQTRLDAQPVFLPAGGTISGGTLKTNIQNRGGEVYDVVLEYKGPHRLTFSRHSLWESGKMAVLTISQRQGENLEWPLQFSIRYRDSLGEEHTRKLEITKAHELRELVPPTWCRNR